MIYLYKGAKGRGKTLTMVKDMINYQSVGWKVYRNMERCKVGEFISNEVILNLSKDSDLFECVLAVDEIQIFFDSRTPTRKENIRFSNFLQQIRKRRIKLLCSTQFANTIDLRLRQHIDIIVFPNYIRRYEVCEVTYFDLTRLEDDYRFINEMEKRPATVQIVFDARKVYPYYDTEEIIGQ